MTGTKPMGSSQVGQTASCRTPEIVVKQASLPHRVRSAVCAGIGERYRPASWSLVPERGIEMGGGIDAQVVVPQARAIAA